MNIDDGSLGTTGTPKMEDKKPSKVSKAVKGVLTATGIVASKTAKSIPVVGDFLSGTEEYQRAMGEDRDRSSFTVTREYQNFRSN